MTVICHARFCGTSTLIGDLLITSRYAPTTSIAIPIARDVNRFVTPADRAVFGMRQKVNVLGNRLAVAWSGALAQAEDVVPSLRPLASVETLTTNQVGQVLDAVEPSRKNSLSLIVAVADQLGGVHLALHNILPPQNIGKISDVVISGTGRPTLLTALRQLSRAQIVKEPLDQEMTSKGFALSIAGFMGGEEIRSTQPLKAGWGGSFEVARFANGSFSKLGKVLFLYFRVTRTKSKYDLWWIPFFRKIDYWNNLTCVRAIQHEITNSGLLTPGREDIFLLSSLGSDIPDMTSFVAPPVMDHSYVVSYIFGAPERDDVLAHVAHWGGPLFSYEFANSCARIAWRSDFIPDLAMRLSQKLKTTPTFQGIRY